MPYPTKYTRQYDFQSYQVSNPTRPLPGDKVNVDLNAVKASVGEIVEFLKNFSRSDGKLANGSVGVNQLDATFQLGFSLPTVWEANVDYTIDSTVLYGNVFYKSNVAHTSTDGFDESKWDVIVDFGAQATDAAASAVAALASQNAAASSATAASGSVTAATAQAADAADSATAASNSATASSGSATTATTQAGLASGSATAAATSETNAAASATAASGFADDASGFADDAAGSATAAAASAASITIASQAEAEAGTENTKLMTPLRVAQYVASAGSGDMVAADYIVSSRSALAGLSTTSATVVFLNEGARSGTFKWNSGDQSSKVAPRSISSTAVDSTAETITSAGHRLKTGDAVIVTSAVNGTSTNTIYYAIRTSSSVFSLASSFANALAGTKFNLTGTTAMTLKVCPDWMQGGVVIPTGSNLDGSQGAWLRVKPVSGIYSAEHFGLEVGGSTDNAPLIRGMFHAMEEAGGGTAVFPTGVIYLATELIARRNVYSRGTGKHSTYLDWHGSNTSYLINGIDNWTDGSYPYDRTMFSFTDMTIDGTNLGGATTIRGLGLTNNHRSPPLLNRVRLRQTTSQGIWFEGDNWNIEFVDVELDTCARVAGAGIQTNTAITSLNHVNFTRVRVEGCGNSASPPTAGGIRIDFTSQGPRGFNFTDCQAEGNFGSDECYFNNAIGVKLDGFYVECNNNGGTGVTTRYGVEMSNCTGTITLLQAYAQAGGNPKAALRVNGSGLSRIILLSMDVGNSWATATLQTDNSAIVKYGYLSALGGTVTLVNNDTSTITAM